MIGLQQIQVFLAVARSGSFVDTARKLSLPRSTVSARIRALEEALNVRLLQRTTRRVALTEEGRRYMERCEQAIDQLVQVHADLSHSIVSGTVRITVPTDMPKTRLSQVLGRFVDLHPATHVEVIVTDEVVDLIANNVDVALRGGAAGADGLVARKLGECPVAFHASPRYIATRLPTRALGDFSGHVILDPLSRVLRDGANKRSAHVRTQSVGLAKALATLSRGIAVLPENVCTDEVRSGSLVRLTYANPIQPLPLYLVMPSRDHLPPRVRAFVDYVTQAKNRAALF